MRQGSNRFLGLGMVFGGGGRRTHKFLLQGCISPQLFVLLNYRGLGLRVCGWALCCVYWDRLGEKQEEGKYPPPD